MTVDPSDSTTGPGARAPAAPGREAQRRWMRLAGGPVLAAFLMGAAGVDATIRMGSRFGIAAAAGWLVLAAAGWALIDITVRYHLRVGRTPISIFKEIHPGVAAVLLALVAASAVLVGARQWTVCAMALVPFYPEIPYALPCGLVAVAVAAIVLFQGDVDRVVKFCAAALVAMIVCFLLAALLVKADGLSGAAPASGRLGAARAVLEAPGAAVVPWLLLLLPYFMIGQGRGLRRGEGPEGALRTLRLGSALGMLALVVAAAAVAVTAGVVARHLDVFAHGYADFAPVLDAYARETVDKSVAAWPAKLFLAGLFLAAWTTGLAAWLGAAWVACDLFRLPLRLKARPMRIALAIVGVPSALVFALQVEPAILDRVLAALSAVAFPLIAFALVWRASRPDMRRRTRARVLLAALGLLALAVSLAAAWTQLRVVLG